MCCIDRLNPQPIADSRYGPVYELVADGRIRRTPVALGCCVGNALRLAAASTAGLQICENLQKEAVQNARRAGRSWSELGALMGITRQAAQQRFAPSKEWFVQEWVATFEGHDLMVRNSWNGGIRLFVDGEQVAENRQLFSIRTERPLLTASVAREKGKPFLVEIFASAVFSVNVKFVVDGKQVGGEVF